MQTKKVFEFSLGVAEDTPTVNGRIYTKAVLDKALKDFGKKIKAKRALAFFHDIKHPEPMTDLKRAAAIITKVRRRKGMLFATMRFLDREKASRVVDLGMLSRPFGIGSFEKDGKTVTNYTLQGIGIYPKEQCFPPKKKRKK
jgi:hypothetical protein